MDRLPVCTLSVLLMSLIGSLWPAAGGSLVYERQAILEGELWRLVTGHLVHFSSLHLAADLLVFGGAGLLIEREQGGRAAYLYLTTAGVIGCALLLFEPQLDRFGGLSGLAYGSVVYLAMSNLRRRGSGSAIALVVLTVLPLKLVIDCVQPISILSGLEFQPFVSVPLSHLVGVLTAGACFISTSKENHHVPV